MQGRQQLRPLVHRGSLDGSAKELHLPQTAGLDIDVDGFIFLIPRPLWVNGYQKSTFHQRLEKRPGEVASAFNTHRLLELGSAHRPLGA